MKNLLTSLALVLALSTAFVAPPASAARMADGCYFLWGEGDEPVGYMCCRGGTCTITWL